MQELWDDALTPNAMLRQLIAAWFSRRYTRFKKRSVDYHGRATDHGLRGTAVPRRHPLKGQARVAALRELRSLASTHQSVTKAIAEVGGASLLTSLLGPFTSHSVGSEAVAILVSGMPLDADAKAALMQPAKVSLVVDMLNEEKGFRSETVASLSLLAGYMRLVRDKRHQDGVATGLELLNSICVVHRPARSMIVSIGAVQQLPELPMECVEPALDILEAPASVPEGRTALNDCPRTIPNAVRLLMRISEACTQRALSMLWVVCRMVPEESAPAALEVGLAAKLLLVIQSGCGPELKQQAWELLKLCTMHCTSTVFLAK